MSCAAPTSKAPLPNQSPNHAHCNLNGRAPEGRRRETWGSPPPLRPGHDGHGAPHGDGPLHLLGVRLGRLPQLSVVLSASLRGTPRGASPPPPGGGGRAAGRTHSSALAEGSRCHIHRGTAPTQSLQGRTERMLEGRGVGPGHRRYLSRTHKSPGDRGLASPVSFRSPWAGFPITACTAATHPIDSFGRIALGACDFAILKIW